MDEESKGGFLVDSDEEDEEADDRSVQMQFNYAIA